MNVARDEHYVSGARKFALLLTPMDLTSLFLGGGDPEDFGYQTWFCRRILWILDLELLSFRKIL